MPTAPEPSSTPDDVYKLFIDTLATETSSSPTAQSVAAEGHFAHATGHEPLNHFVASLAAEQRQLLADMLRDEREAAIHDVLALLSWFIHCQGVELTYRGKAM